MSSIPDNSISSIVQTANSVFLVLFFVGCIGLYFGNFYNQNPALLWWIMGIIVYGVVQYIYSLIFSWLISFKGRQNKWFVFSYTIAFSLVLLYFNYRQYYSPIDAGVIEKWLWCLPYLVFLIGAAVSGFIFRKRAPFFL